MERNISLFEVIIRILSGITTIIVGLMAFQSITIMIIGMAVVIFSITGWCPVYAFLGRSTCESEMA